MDEIGFIILIIVVVFISRSIINACKKAFEKAESVRQDIGKLDKINETIAKGPAPKPIVQRGKQAEVKVHAKQAEKEEPHLEIKLDSIEEVRRSIIYSEIINRKY